MRPQPRFGAAPFGENPLDRPPKTFGVIELDAVRDFMGGEIVEHQRRGEHQPPGKRKRSAMRARAPAARRVAQRNGANGNAEHFGIAAARGEEIAPRFALEEITRAAAQGGNLKKSAKAPAVSAARA